ncbi:enoyl-CoA hydratase [uncultured Sphingosinicella sp.]|jgi:enoyl-CoA hydratase|uniref:enoyl-CoA hydratase n=1 Tax=uncultured Sphingosinicella sp. TaxID=478748 RepID=UPI0030DC3004|tara:strand:+ start:89921 stop:90691 length:771 start_codon:yes stop_codon:yes gene_type:complete
MAVVEIERCGGYAVVTMNRPEAMNALSKALRSELARSFDALEADPDIRVAILTGAGERAFTAGLDLKELGSGASSLGDAVEKDDPVSALRRFSGPVIGAINGVAITGGFELALACDVLIASETARFADTHARIGLMPGWGLSQRLSRAIGISRAKELSLTGNFIDAVTAERWGLVNRVVAPADLMPAARRLAEDMISADPAMLKALKALIDDGFALPFGEAMTLERERSAGNSAIGAEAVEARRKAVLDRGRTQAS